MKQISRPPFLVCPRCGEKSFGISEILPGYYLRKCNKCFYPDSQRNEPEVNYILPHLSKRIIYIDQFALSYMVRALHPNMKATETMMQITSGYAYTRNLIDLSKCRLLFVPNPVFIFRSQQSLIFLNLWKECTIYYQEAQNLSISIG